MTPRLADVLLAELRADPTAAADIASVLAPTLAASVPKTARVAYTVDALAKEVSVTPRAVRAAIGRGDLAAVKRGGRWLIAAESVNGWVSARGILL